MIAGLMRLLKEGCGLHAHLLTPSFQSSGPTRITCRTCTEYATCQTVEFMSCFHGAYYDRHSPLSPSSLLVRYMANAAVMMEAEPHPDSR